MMIKYRVSDVAKDFGVTGKTIIDLLARFSDTPKKSATALQEDELDLVFEYFTQAHQSDNLDSYFAEAEARRAAKNAKPSPEAKEAPAEKPEEAPEAGTETAAAVVIKPPKKEKAPATPRAPVERRMVDTLSLIHI